MWAIHCSCPQMNNECIMEIWINIKLYGSKLLQLKSLRDYKWLFHIFIDTSSRALQQENHSNFNTDSSFLTQDGRRETFRTLLALCASNPPVTGGFPSQRPVTWSFDVFFNLHLNEWLSKQFRCRWFETSSRSLWRHCNAWFPPHIDGILPKGP